MGFMDKAKKMAEQAQTKLDEAQKQFNERQAPAGDSPAGDGGPAVEYDAHGRPVPAAPSPEGVTPPHGDPAAPASPPPPPIADPSAATVPMETAPPPAPPVPAAPPAPPAPPSGGPDVEEDRNRPSYAPPKLSPGDPLAG